MVEATCPLPFELLPEEESELLLLPLDPELPELPELLPLPDDELLDPEVPLLPPEELLPLLLSDPPPALPPAPFEELEATE